jgi:nicotinic acid mononucleotide adenylyltransferase
MILVHGEHPASATAIRAALAKGETEIPHLDPEVERIIRNRALNCG